MAVAQAPVTASKIMRVAAFIRDCYSYLIILSLVAATIAGTMISASVRMLTPYTVWFIAVMIWAMSVTTRFSELSLAFRKGRLIVWGLVANFVFLPFLCYMLATSLMAGYPLYAAGFILMGTVPSAGMSVVWTGLLQGDVALALLLDVLTDLLGIVTIPWLTLLLAGAYVVVDVTEMLGVLVLAVLLPIAFGMLTRRVVEKRSGGKAKDYLAAFPSTGALMAVLLMFMMVSVNVPMIPAAADVLLALLVPPLILFPIAFGGVYLFCDRVLKCAENETVALVYSSGMKHLPLAMGVAFVSLGQQAALPIALAAVFQTMNARLFHRIFQAGRHLTTRLGKVRANP